jgi:3-oxoacyl-[acyl-carrier-protein] synthase-1
LINEVDVKRLGAAQRLQGPENPQGLIPGEGSAFILLTLPGNSLTYRPLGQVLGVGTAIEKDTVLGERYSVGKGLRQALEEATKDAACSEPSIDFLVSDMNGERYRAWESLICHSRFYRTRRAHLNMWYLPASVGDIGAASGALLVIVAAMAIARGYAPGQIAMCEGSSEEGLRAACLIGPSLESPPCEGSRNRIHYGQNTYPSVQSIKADQFL